MVFNGVVSESAQAQDAVASLGVFNASVVESITAQDEAYAGASFVAQIIEDARAFDQFIGRLLWDVIDTSETTVWGVIDTGVSGNWGHIDTAQTQNWNTITTVQLELRSTVGGGFSAGAISSGPFSALGGENTVVIRPDEWQNVNTSETTNWQVVETQT